MSRSFVAALSSKLAWSLEIAWSSCVAGKQPRDLAVLFLPTARAEKKGQNLNRAVVGTERYDITSATVVRDINHSAGIVDLNLALLFYDKARPSRLLAFHTYLGQP
jgi:hypothetical protein